MAEMNRFSTLDLPSGVRFKVWQERLRRSFGEVKGSSRSTREFTAWSDRLSEGEISLSHMRVDAQTIELPPDSVTGYCRNSIQVVFPLDGQFHIEQRGRTVVLSPGDWGLYDPSIGFKSVNEGPVELLVLAAPRATMLGRGVSSGGCTAQRFSSATGSAQVAKSYLASVLDVRGALSALASAELITVAAQLVRLSILENLAQPSKASQRALLRARIQAYVDRNLRDPDLSIDSIASVHNCSKRYVHKIFSGTGQTLSHYIRSARLERCRRDLGRVELTHLSVTEIAFSWGFQHQAHFSRVFRNHFNVAPSCCRQQLLKSA
jgi:AraC-like DNA-binding protein